MIEGREPDEKGVYGGGADGRKQAVSAMARGLASGVCYTQNNRRAATSATVGPSLDINIVTASVVLLSFIRTNSDVVVLTLPSRRDHYLH